MNPHFFKISEAAVGGNKYPWACGYGPLSEMPFFERLENLRERKERYWEVNPEPPGIEIDPGGREWSDLIGCGHSPPMFFVGQRVIDSLAREGIPILRKTMMPIAKVNAKRLKDLEPSSYYVLEAIPGMAVDWAAMGVTTKPDGQPNLTGAHTMNPPRLVPDTSSWTGLDLFSFSNRGASVHLYCTERVRRLAKEQKWTNVDFVPIG